MSENTGLFILKELIKPEKEFETHISHVLIKGNDVYKLKKSVDFGFLNFKLAKDRKRFCILEKELNERFADNVYENTLKIVRKGNNFDLVPVTSTLTAIDYVVKMKRIPDENFLKSRIEKGLISEYKAKDTGRQIAKLFKAIETPKESAEEHNGLDIIRFNCEENFEQTLKYVDNLIDSEKYEYIQNATLTFIDTYEEIIRKRVDEGFVKDGHGDLRLEHVFFDGNKVGLLDCIEFNRRLRFNDVVSDFVFLCMELDQEGLYSLSDAFLEGFLSIFDDEESAQLINFYKCYRAFVRLKVACFMLDAKGEKWENYSAKAKEVNRLLNLSFTYALNMFNTNTLIFSGLMGTGKSKNAKAFCSEYPSSLFSTDYYRKITAGIDPEKKIYEDFGKGLYSEANTINTYKYLGNLAKEKKNLGRMAVIDGSFSKKDFFDAFINHHNLHVININFTASEQEILRRLGKRITGKTVSDGRPELYEKQKQKAEKIPYHLQIDTTDADINDNLNKIVKCVAEKNSKYSHET